MAVREHFAPRKIEAINPQRDGNVCIFGTVIQKLEDSVLVDDGSGSAEVFLDEEDLKGLEEKQSVRIFGTVLPTPDSFELQGVIVQDASDIDPNTYGRVQELVQ